jgi:hypothetical protein
MDSYLALEDGTMCSMWVPSGDQTGLKIVSGITVTTNRVSDYTLDFDVRKSVSAPPGHATASIEACAQNYLLKPAIRIVDTTQVGSIQGSVDPLLLAACRDDPIDGIADHVAVYVFEDFDPLNAVTVDDYDGDGDAIASASVVGDGGAYSYEVGYLLPGDYRLGLTCTADVDGTAADEFDCVGDSCATTDPVFTFLDEQSVTVVAGAASSAAFLAP